MQMQAQMAMMGGAPHLPAAHLPAAHLPAAHLPAAQLPHVPSLNMQLPLPGLLTPLGYNTSSMYSKYKSIDEQNKRKSHPPLPAQRSASEGPKGSAKKHASTVIEKRSNSMSMLDDDIEGYDPASMEDKDVKRLRRKQSNRESARRSRLRKQAECESLQEENQLLKGEVLMLRKENADLNGLVLRLQERVESLNQQAKHERRPTPEVVE
jgi:hypothetical protein